MNVAAEVVIAEDFKEAESQLALSCGFCGKPVPEGTEVFTSIAEAPPSDK